MDKIKIGILGATGIIGQNYIKLLQNHPWFEIIDVAASPRSEGKLYEVAVEDKWQMTIPIPEYIKKMKVRDVQKIKDINPDVKFVFSAMDLETKDATKAVEFEYAKQGIPVVSNSSANRWTPDVPMLIPEINHEHIKVIPIQRKNHMLTKGFVVVKPNCSCQSFLTPIYALEQADYKIDQIIMTTLQAVSGAGYPGVPSLDMIDNIVPYIGGEEEKTEKEPLKILGKITEKGIENYTEIKISSTCTRVPVQDGHTACLNVKFKNKSPEIDEIIKIWNDFRSVPQELKLPFAPKQPIIYLNDLNRPQPRKDRDTDKGMAVSVGRLRKDTVYDIKFIVLSHNTIRGAAGGAILSAELLHAKHYFD